MKVLSVLQPWASLILMGVKLYEVRGWQTKYRGELLIHASAKKPTIREKFFFEHAEYFSEFIKDMNLLPYGCIIAKCELDDIFETSHLINDPGIEKKNFNWQQQFAFDDFSAGRYAWRIKNIHPLKNFLPMKGTLGLWEYNGLIE